MTERDGSTHDQRLNEGVFQIAHGNKEHPDAQYYIEHDIQQRKEWEAERERATELIKSLGQQATTRQLEIAF